MKRVLFSCTDLTVGMPGTVQARQLHLTFFQGEAVALVGSLNSGLAAFVQYLRGEQPRQAGTVCFNGMSGSAGERHLFSGRVFCSPTAPARFYQRENDGINLMDYLFLDRKDGCAGFWWKRRQMEERASVLLEKAGLNRSPQALLSELTLPERLLLDIAKAIDLGAEMVVFDENMDHCTKDEIEMLAGVMERCKREQRFAFVLSVGSRWIGRLADRCVWFKDGTILRKLSGSGIQQAVMQWTAETVRWEKPPVSQAATAPIWEAENLPYAHGRFRLQVFPGEALHLVERDPARREQLFRLLSGQERTAGVMRYQGTPMPRTWPFQRQRYPIVPVAELNSKALFSNFTVRQNLLFFSLPKLCGAVGWLPPASVWATAEREWDAPRQPMPQNLALLTGLETLDLQLESLHLLHPQVVLFRDPFASVDTEGRRLLLQAFERMRRRNTAVVVISASHTSYLGSSALPAANWYDRLLDLAEVMG